MLYRKNGSNRTKTSHTSSTNSLQIICWIRAALWLIVVRKVAILCIMLDGWIINVMVGFLADDWTEALTMGLVLICLWRF